MSTSTDTTGYVLAGGKSHRMGRDKALLDWYGQPLVEHMRGLLSIVCNTVQVVGRDGLPDTAPGMGPIGGISTALDASTTSENLIVAVDLPLLTIDFMKYFKEHFVVSPYPLIVCNAGSAFPLFLGIRRTLRRPIHEYMAAGGRSVHGFLTTTPCEVISAEQLSGAGFPPGLFMNINTEADYHAALAAYKP